MNTTQTNETAGVFGTPLSQSNAKIYSACVMVMLYFCTTNRYFTGGEEELELADLIDGLERFRLLGNPDERARLAKEEQPFLDGTFGKLPEAKRPDAGAGFQCANCGKVYSQHAHISTFSVLGLCDDVYAL